MNTTPTYKKVLVKKHKGNVLESTNETAYLKDLETFLEYHSTQGNKNLIPTYTDLIKRCKERIARENHVPRKMIA